MRAPHSFAYSGLYSNDTTTKKRSKYSPMFIAALITIARTCKQAKCPSTEEWIKSGGKYIQWTIGHKKEQNIAH